MAIKRARTINDNTYMAKTSYKFAITSKKCFTIFIVYFVTLIVYYIFIGVINWLLFVVIVLLELSYSKLKCNNFLWKNDM